MKSALGYLVLFCILVFAEAGKFRCDYTYFPDARGWLKLHSESIWSIASYRCDLEGAQLASPTNEGIKDAMMSLIYEHNKTMAVHTGIHPRENTNEINVELDEEAYVLNRHGALERARQNDYYPFICYKKADASVELNECSTVDNEYILDNRTDHCYKLHRTHAPWSLATLICDAEESTLAVINSEVEAQVIRDLFARYPSETIPLPAWKDSAFLGFRRNEFLDVEWKTISGQTLREAGYDEFSPGEPNNANGNEFCGSVGRNGKLFDDPCTRPLLFICERTRQRTCDVPLSPFTINKILRSKPKHTYLEQMLRSNDVLN